MGIDLIKFDDDKASPEIKKSPEERSYLILFKSSSSEEYDNYYEIIKGRLNTRKTLIDYIELYDLEETLVLVETTSLEKAITAYDFLKYCERFVQDDFYVDSYVEFEPDDNDPDSRNYV